MYSDSQLWKLLDGELLEAEASAILAAAAADEALHGRIEALRGLKSGVLEGTPAVPPDFAARTTALALGRARTPLVDLDEARRFLRRALVAAAVLAAVGITYLAIEVGPKLFAPSGLQAQDPLLGR